MKNLYGPWELLTGHTKDGTTHYEVLSAVIDSAGARIVLYSGFNQAIAKAISAAPSLIEASGNLLKRLPIAFDGMGSDVRSGSKNPPGYKSKNAQAREAMEAALKGAI